MTIKNILIVEDDIFQQSVLKHMLAIHFLANIVVVNNGFEALEKIQVNNFDLILCDLHMPLMDGIELLRRFSELKVDAYIAITSSVEPELQNAVLHMANFYQLNKVCLLSKPVSSAAIKQLIKQIDAQKEVSPRVEQSIQISDAEIIEGLSKGQFFPYFQPHFASQTLKITGAEALVRWQHPQLGLLSPFHFLTQLYQQGLGEILTKTILSQAIKACANWHQQNWPLHISVNVEHSDLMDVNFTNYVLELLEKHQLATKYLTIELTETEISDDMGKSLENLTRLRLNGINISIDDFGTGHSSLSQLIYSPFTELKIDQLFIKNMLENRKYLAAVKTSLALADSLGLKTVAEGVETEQVMEQLQAMNCHTLQGYYLAKPMAIKQFNELCTKNLQIYNIDKV